MIPLYDDVPHGRTPIVMYSLVVANIIIFGYELFLDAGGNLEPFIYDYALIPYNVVHLTDLHTFLTSMFMHGSYSHIIFNMLFLYIFGNNVEDNMGHTRFITFYIITGICASLLQIAFNPASDIPNLGASGAISGVLAGYLVLHPKAKITTLIPLGYVMMMRKISALYFIGFWFVLQFFSGIASLGVSTGIAFWAHIGGFVSGLLLIYVFRKESRIKKMGEHYYFDDKF